MICALIASLAVNGLLLVLLTGRAKIARAWRRWRDPWSGPLDYPALAAERFGTEPAGGRVAFVGDSHIQDAPLIEMVTDFRQRGIGRATIAQVASWLGPVLAEPPERVVFCAGSNNVLDGQTPEQIVAEMAAVLDRIGGRSAVTLVAIPPLHGHEAAVAAANRALRDLADAHGCGWVDPTAGLDDWSDDGVHLNRRANLHFGQLLRDELRQSATG